MKRIVISFIALTAWSTFAQQSNNKSVPKGTPAVLETVTGKRCAHCSNGWMVKN